MSDIGLIRATQRLGGASGFGFTWTHELVPIQPCEFNGLPDEAQERIILACGDLDLFSVEGFAIKWPKVDPTDASLMQTLLTGMNAGIFRVGEGSDGHRSGIFASIKSLPPALRQSLIDGGESASEIDAAVAATAV
ncbi:MAG TPA: hypothetical protein VH370_01370 [Humisphaera sp.]|nr:hypothetical protein [Humisphaera sp.]